MVVRKVSALGDLLEEDFSFSVDRGARLLVEMLDTAKFLEEEDALIAVGMLFPLRHFSLLFFSAALPK